MTVATIKKYVVLMGTFTIKVRLFFFFVTTTEEKCMNGFVGNNEWNRKLNRPNLLARPKACIYFVTT